MVYESVYTCGGTSVCTRCSPNVWDEIINVLLERLSSFRKAVQRSTRFQLLERLSSFRKVVQRTTPSHHPIKWYEQ